MADGSYQLEGCGDCAWSVEHCFLNSNPSRPTLTNLQEVSKNHNLQIEIIGEELWNKYKKWPMFSKFFDNLGPLPHHIHHRDQHAKRVGGMGRIGEYGSISCKRILFS